MGAYSASRQLEQKHGLNPCDISENIKIYKKDIGMNQVIEITVIGESVSISINSLDENIILIPIAERYCPRNNKELDFLLIGSSRLAIYFKSL
jgi:hypothetical protein